MAVDHVSYSLPPTSRLHFGRVYHIKHDVRVKSVGVIHVDSISDFVNYYKSSLRGFSVPNAIEKVTRRVGASDLKSRNTTYKHEMPLLEEDFEDPIKLQDKAKANLEALCVSDQAELFVIAKYDSEDHRLDVSRYPNRLKFKRGDKIKVLDAGVLPMSSTKSIDMMTMHESTLSRDPLSPTLIWWLGELNGCQGQFPWWYMEIE